MSLRCAVPVAVLSAGLLMLASAAADAAKPQPSPLCDPLVRPETLAKHSGRDWRPGPGLSLKGDSLVCNYYQKDPPAGFSLSVRNDSLQDNEFKGALQTHERALHPVSGLGDEAFFFRHETSEPFQPSWGLIVRAKKRTYRIEGVPEAGKPDEARALAREIVERAIQKF